MGNSYSPEARNGPICQIGEKLEHLHGRHIQVQRHTSICLSQWSWQRMAFSFGSTSGGRMPLPIIPLESSVHAFPVNASQCKNIPYLLCSGDFFTSISGGFPARKWLDMRIQRRGRSNCVCDCFVTLTIIHNVALPSASILDLSSHHKVMTSQPEVPMSR